MSDDKFERGNKIRAEVLGADYVNRGNADEFMAPLSRLSTEFVWGEIWSQPELPRKTRSMLNLAMISVLNRPHELRAHLRGALRNGVSREEISEVFLQVMIYAGAPAAVDAFRTAREVFAEMDKKA